MIRVRKSWKPVLTAALLIPLMPGCETTGGGGSVNSYYGTGFYDPWYYGAYYDRSDIIAAPPPPRPTHPIAPAGPGPRPTPLPSIPARPMPRAR